ncbi:MAG TPA: DUF2807 domain-containing protein [Vitreimonas sp.]|uniref:GIN domain-containing protein n=1 Tax=Vitreimonas sp. TaxID=3069702 RepID=UPI002D48D134|nr:DUF2807 domain-containing protein [Vitreimonas sp.]HYD87490.1 DUF2807 domain-containing protein [Vitreimonas sp.]
MKRLAVTAVLAMLMAGPAMAETRNHRGFDSVGAQDQIRVEITVGGEYAVDVSGRDAERVLTEVEGGTLKIRQRNRPWFGSRHLDATVRISMPELESVAAARGAELTATGVDAQHFEIAAAMGAEVRVRGTCSSLDAAAAMGAVIRADELLCQTADVAAAMGGDARVYASQSYEGAASMGGTINVAGEGADRGSSTAMGGSIND